MTLYATLGCVLRPPQGRGTHPKVVFRIVRTGPVRWFSALFQFGAVVRVLESVVGVARSDLRRRHRCDAGAGVGGWRGRSARWVVWRGLAQWVRTLKERAPWRNPRDSADLANNAGVMTVLQRAARASAHAGAIPTDSSPDVDSACFQGKPGFGRVHAKGLCVQTRNSGSARRATRGTGPSPAGRQHAGN